MIQSDKAEEAVIWSDKAEVVMIQSDKAEVVMIVCYQRGAICHKKGDKFSGKY